MTTHGVARDQLRAFVERIERLEEEKKTIADDIKDVYGEAKSMGFDTKVLKKLIAIRKKDEQERMEEEVILDTYMHALGMIPQLDMFGGDEAKLSREDRRRRRTTEAMDDHKSLVDEMADAGLISEEAREENKRLADAVATKFGNGPAAALQSPRKAADAVSERAATNQLETVNELVRPASDAVPGGEPSKPTSHDGGAKMEALPGFPGRSDDTSGHKDVEWEEAATSNSTIAPASHGEAEGAVIRFELCPPRPMKRLPFVHCFPELTKTEYDRLSISISENGVEDPIIRDGDTIVDGWNRYNIARSLGMEYPVKQFEGGDVLSFVIDAQRASRGWSQSQERKIAAALCKELPHRAHDINAAFRVEEEFA